MTAAHVSVTGNYASNGSTQINVPYGYVHFGHDSKAKTIQDWLLPPEDIGVYFKNLNKNKDKRSHNTGAWLIQHDGLFAEWLGTSANPAPPRSLWLNGTGKSYSTAFGRGKSVLCSSIVQELPEYLARLHCDGAAYQDLVLHIFLSYEDEVKYHTPDTVLRALLRQLCIGESVPEEIERLYRDSQLGVSTKSLENTLFQILERMRESEGVAKASIESTGKQGQSIIRSITIVVDAVDELPPKQKNGLLGLITSLSNFKSGESNFALRLVIATRPERYMAARCAEPSWYVNCMQSSNIDTDIQTFIRERLDDHYKMGQQDSESKSRIVELISGRVQGMFRLAELYMDELEHLDYYDVPEYEVEELLEQRRLPNTLDGFYDHILKRTEQAELRSDMFVILKWVLLAARRMTVEELLDACATLRTDGSKFDERRQRICKEFPERLSGLITVGKSPGHGLRGLVTIAHFSVREYIIRIQPMDWPQDALRYDLNRAQAYAAKCCVDYLLHFHRSSPDSRPFYEYAWRHWATHAACHYVHTLHVGNGTQTAAGTPAYHTTRPSSLSLRLANIVERPSVYGTLPSDESLAMKVLNTCDISEADRQTLILSLGAPAEYEVLQGDLGQSGKLTTIPRYEPLPDSVPDAIRLIAVHPSSNSNGPISCTAFVDSLANNPRYYALSYSWKYDDEIQDVSILINGGVSFIRRNLACALRRLRRESEVIVLWVDVICISMGDLYEHGYQVRLMDQVFGTAEATIMFLGEETSPNEALTVTVRTDHSREVKDLLSPSRYCTACIAAMFDRPLWNKTWILTEFVIARRIIIMSGRTYIDWPDATMLTVDDPAPSFQPCPGKPGCQNSPELEEALNLRQKARMQMYRRLRNNRLENASDPSRTGLNLPQLLFYSRELEVTNPRDKIITMLNLATAAERIEMSHWFDYNLSTQDIGIAVAKHCLEKQKNLDLLSMTNLRHYSYNLDLEERDLPPPVHRYRNNSFADAVVLPSWVPTWHCTMWKTPLAPGDFDPTYERVFAAAPPLSSAIEIQDDRALKLEAVIIDTIGSLYSFRHFYYYERDYNGFLTPRDDLNGLMRRTVCNDRKCGMCYDPTTVDNGGMQSAFQAFRSRYNSHDQRRGVLKRTILALPPSAINIVGEESRLSHRDGAQYQMENNKCRKVALGVKGHAALVPAWAQQDDMIMILKGGAVPYVLRPQLEGHSTYKLVGECYVDGTMNGEAIPADDNQWFRILLV